MMGCDLPAVGITQHINYGNLNMYPNPNNGKFYIDLPKELLGKEGNYQIIDLLGKTVYSNTIALNQKNILIDTKLSVGMYTIILNGDGLKTKYTGKILIN
jgi:hypothetical protein